MASPRWHRSVSEVLAAFQWQTRRHRVSRSNEPSRHSIRGAFGAALSADSQMQDETDQTRCPFVQSESSKVLIQRLGMWAKKFIRWHSLRVRSCLLCEPRPEPRSTQHLG